MREVFWGVYQTVVYKSFYYQAYQARVESLVFWSRAVCAVVSILSVLIWSISKTLPVLWACLIALAQLAQTLLGFLPWEKQANSLHYLVPALSEFVVDATQDWLRLGYCEQDDDSALSEAAVRLDRGFCELETRYTNGVWFPRRESAREHADKDWDDFMAVRYNCPKGDEERAEQEPNGAG